MVNYLVLNQLIIPKDTQPPKDKQPRKNTRPPKKICDCGCEQPGAARQCLYNYIGSNWIPEWKK
jgi:hypothetical protein